MSISAVFAIADASATKRGAVNILAQTFAGVKTFPDGIVGNLTGQPSALLGHNLSGTPSNGQVLGFNGTSWAPTTASAGLQGEVNVRDFGAKGDGVTDDWAAFKAAHDSFQPDGGDNWRGGVINIPRGRYYLSQTWVITKEVVIRGAAGPGFQIGNAGTVLMFAAGQTGIRLHSSFTAPDGGNASSTQIHDIQVYANAKSTTAHGIHASCRVFLSNVECQNFATDGCRILASVGNSSGNANGWGIDRCSFINNGGDGLHVEGSDVNVGLCTNCSSTNNGGWQIYDWSYLGSVYQACLAESPYPSRGTYLGHGSGSSFIGCYLEYGGNFITDITEDNAIINCGFDFTTNGPQIDITGDGSGASALVNYVSGAAITSVLMIDEGSGYTTATATVVRGYSRTADDATFTPVIVGGKIKSLTITHGGSGYDSGCWQPGMSLNPTGTAGGFNTNAITAYQRVVGVTRPMKIMLAGTSTNECRLISSSPSSVGSDIFYLLSWNEAKGSFETKFNGIPASTGLRFVHSLSTTEKGGRSTVLPGGSLEFPNGFWLGSNDDASHVVDTQTRYVGNGTAAPVTGEWAQGDIIFNKALVGGDPSGWICETGGTPGVWRVFGSTYYSQKITDGLMAYYGFENNVLDSTVEGHTGTATAITYAAGKKGQAGVFNGTTSKVTISRFGDGPGTPPTDFHTGNGYTVSGITLSAWVKTTSAATNIYDCGNPVVGDGPAAYFTILGVDAGKARMSVAAPSYTHFNGTTFINDGTWHHIAATIDMSFNVVLYVDGVQEASGTLSQWPGNTGLLGIGAGGDGNFYTGSIDEVAVWRRPLGSDEITKLYNGGAGLDWIGTSTLAPIPPPKFAVGSVTPIGGVWNKGDIMYNSAPTAGGFVGWVCTTGGTPGTWKTFGAISA